MFIKERALKLPEFLNKAEQAALISIPNKRYFTGQRNKLMIKIMLKTGTRISECLSLKWQDVDLFTGKIMIREGKGKKDRILWVKEEMLNEIIEWRERQSSQLGKSKIIFTTFKGGSVGPRYVQHMIKRYADKAGITKNITPHSLRHTFATDLLRSAKNIRLVQKALGHAYLSTTMIYTHIEDDELEQAMKKL